MVNLHVQHKKKQKILSYINQYYHFLFLQNSVQYIVKISFKLTSYFLQPKLVALVENVNRQKAVVKY